MRTGWEVVVVPKDDGPPSLAYSLGLFKNFGHPEVVVFGDDLAVMQGVVDRIGGEVMKGRRFADGEYVAGIVDGYKVHLGEIPWCVYAERDDFAQAHQFYGGSVFPLMQGYWPQLGVCCP